METRKITTARGTDNNSNILNTHAQWAVRISAPSRLLKAQAVALFSHCATSRKVAASIPDAVIENISLT
jgi:hypothetical protein